MVTFAQAQERAERWVNGDVPAYQHRDVEVREFDLGFIAWAEDHEDRPTTDGGRARLVIARDSGEATLWPALPVGEIIRRYEEEYGTPPEDAGAADGDAAPQRIDLEATSFLLTPPEWLQEAADQIGIPERRSGTTAGAGFARTGSTGTGGSGGSVGSNGSRASGGSAGPDGAGSDSSAGSTDAAGSASTGTPDAGAAAAAAYGATPEGEPPGSATEAGAGAAAAGASWPDAHAQNEEPAPASYETTAGTSASAPGPGTSPGGTPWADANTHGPDDDRSVELPATVFAPPLVGDDEDTPQPGVPADAKTELMSGGSQLPRTAVNPAIDDPSQAGPGEAGPGAPGSGAPAVPPQPPLPPNVPGAPGTPPSHGQGASDIADAATARAPRNPNRGGVGTPPPPGAPGTPGAGAPPASGPGAPGAPAGGYIPTQLVSALPADAAQDGPGAPGAPGTPGTPGDGGPAGPGGPGGVHAAATMFADSSGSGFPGTPGSPPPPGPPGVPGTPPPPGPPGTPGAGAPNQPGPPGTPGAPGTPGTPGVGGPGGVHAAATMFAEPSGPGNPGAPGAPGGPGGIHAAATMLSGGPAGPTAPGPGIPGPGMPPGAQPPGAPGMPPGAQPAGAPGAYGYPQPPAGVPMVGPGYMAVLRYRAPDGSEQQLIRRSAPGTPHPEWQILHELNAMGVPPQQVLELHTELESCELPGGYCARMIRETWPQVRISNTAPYGRDHATRQQGVRHLIEHQGELHQVADGPARPAPNRVPLPHPGQVQPAPPVPPQGLAHELVQAFGPQAVFRFDQRAVSRQGVPEVVAQTLVWAGLPVEIGPFFWAQAQPGRPVPTLAELAAERGVQPAPDAGSYLVMGNDFGRQLCVQYGTANIVAVPVEAGPDGQSATPQFVNSGLPEFVRCLALLGHMWRLRYGLTPEQAGRWTVDFQAQLASLDPAALSTPENWWAVLLEQMWDGLL
ncbi:SUKH-4 family immunity protein [Streptomyces sp. NPDC048639]|uniref:SUKH-4 family immunity protein n=1 Tax=Streptomyces sp. NPDC048639 TaxID=3365581 RepID=UPI0037109E48